MSTETATNKQLCIILEEIATTANALGSLAADLGMHNQSMFALRSISEKIGFLADLGLEKIEGAPNCVGDAIDWMLPNFRDAEKELEESHG